KSATDPEQRQALMQALWSVALADGDRDAEEDQLLRLVASLLGLTDVQSGLARQRAGK
ncbi:MAG: TerB family tellurite resistance protein, partial [Rhodobacteraceae bacterium]|nr:TerB family tellurite resistance protein [Paracoccaceae bacterium]